jgi:hypothetical protein
MRGGNLPAWNHVATGVHARWRYAFLAAVRVEMNRALTWGRIIRASGFPMRRVGKIKVFDSTWRKTGMTLLIHWRGG